MKIKNNFLFKKVNSFIKRVIIFFYPYSFPQKKKGKLSAEKSILYPLCKGIGIDVGCGSEKIYQDAIGIDLTKKGDIGKYGSEKRQISNADISMSGDDLYLFADNVFDYVVSSHTLEHFSSPNKALLEWKRVLKKGGNMGIIVPDDKDLDTMKLDKTHKHAFTRKKLIKLISDMEGFKIIKTGDAIKNWSFYIIAKKIK